MRRWWAAAIAAVVALAVGIAVADGSGSGPTARLAYVTGPAGSAPVIWVARVDGKDPRALGRGSRPLLSPSGTLVAASGRVGLILYRSSGGVVRRYFDSPDATAVAADFSPDSRYIAVVLSSTNPASIAFSGLAVIDTTTLAARIIVRGQIYGASFAPDGSDRIAYASAPSAALRAPVDVHVIDPGGSNGVQITHDGRNLNPVWGRGGIVLDHERLRSRAEPAYQLWLMPSDGGAPRRLTNMAIPPLRDGLVPVDFSADGNVLLADYVGQDTSAAWLVKISSGQAIPLDAALVGAALSRDGTSALVDRGGFLTPPNHGTVESLPLPRGRPRVLVAHGSEPGWNA